MSTRIPRAPDPALLPAQLSATGQVPHPALSSVTTNDITAEQDATKRDVNDPEIRRLMDRKTGRQVPMPPAGAPEFQPHEPDYVKREERWQHGTESAGAYGGMDEQPGRAPGGLPRDLIFDAKTRIVGDMVTGPDPQGRFQLPKANPPGDLVTGAEVPTARRPMIKDWPSDQEQTTVNNAPEPGQGSELR